MNLKKNENQRKEKNLSQRMIEIHINSLGKEQRICEGENFSVLAFCESEGLDFD